MESSYLIRFGLWSQVGRFAADRPGDGAREGQGYTLRELMEYMGHSSLQATERYVKLLPPLDETDPA